MPGMEPPQAAQDSLPQGHRPSDPQWRQREVVEGSFVVRVPFETIESKKLTENKNEPKQHREDDELVASGRPVSKAVAARLEQIRNHEVGPFDALSFTQNWQVINAALDKN